MSWRDISKKIIAKAIEEVGPDFDKISRNYYPFGDRKYHPYHIWLDEIARQRKEHQPKKDERQDELFPGGDSKYTIEALRDRLRELDEKNQTQANCLAAREKMIDRLEDEVRRLNRTVDKAIDWLEGGCCDAPQSFDCEESNRNCRDCWKERLESEVADNG